MRWRGEALLPRRRAVRQIFGEHLVTAGNTVWTSGNRRLHRVVSILSGFLLCLAVLRLRRAGLLYMVIGWGKRTFVHFFLTWMEHLVSLGYSSPFSPVSVWSSLLTAAKRLLQSWTWEEGDAWARVDKKFSLCWNLALEHNFLNDFRI